MLIAIAADLHDNLLNWQKFNDYILKQNINVLLFCGDLTAIETIKKMSKEFPGDIYAIAGNAELYDPKSIKNSGNFHFLGDYGYVELDNKKIGLIHEPIKMERLLKLHPNLDYVFYGHTHKPWLENRDGLIAANPGNLAGISYRATFAILDTDNKKLELKILDLF